MKNYFTEQEAGSMETSMEILEAISELSETKEQAVAMWEDGSDSENVVAIAWNKTIEDEDTLCWGEEIFTR